jgi:hypothetical protein
MFNITEHRIQALFIIRITALALMVVGCKGNENRGYKLRPVYSIDWKPYDHNIPKCEGINQTIRFFNDTTFYYQEYCNEDSLGWNRGFGGSFIFRNDSIVFLRGEKDSLWIKILDSNRISILDFGGTKQIFFAPNFPLVYDSVSSRNRR